MYGKNLPSPTENYAFEKELLPWEYFFFDRKPRMNILIEKEVQKEDEESSRQK